MTAPLESRSLPQVAAEQLEAARGASSGRSTTTIFGSRETVHRQVLLALVAGRSLSEHDNPGEATAYVVTGRVRIRAGDVEWTGHAGDHLVIPPQRHDLTAEEDSAVLLTVARH